jgi:hypothetical protein
MTADYMGHLPALHKIVHNNEWMHLLACVVGMLLWAGASAAAWYNCDDLCALTAPQPAGYSRTLQYATLCCQCGLPAGARFGPYCSNLANGPSYPSTTYEERTRKYEATQALTIIET